MYSTYYVTSYIHYIIMVRHEIIMDGNRNMGVEIYNYLIIHTPSLFRNKLMKWWAQSFLLGVPKIVCGFRDDNGTVNSLHSFRTIDIPRECQVRKQVTMCSVTSNKGRSL